MTDETLAPEVLFSQGQAPGVRRITLNRPEKRNAISRPMFAELTEAFTREPSANERVTILDAVGPTFCSGVDLSQRTEGGDSEGQSPLELLCSAIRDYPLPVVAVLQGSAIGGGAMIALHCDFVVASAEAKVGNSAVQLGLVPAWSVARHIRDLVGPALAAQVLLLGDLIPAPELASAGVITAAVDPDDLLGAVDRIIGRLAANAPLSLRAIKATLSAVDFNPVSHETVLDKIRAAQQSEDAKEGVRARTEKREPDYNGR
jgi:enoyl-CoA hydratase/carnithine racemase